MQLSSLSASVLVEIITTRDVFRFEKEGYRVLDICWKLECEYIKFDVTDMTFETYTNRNKSDTRAPKTSYLEQIFEHEEHWRRNDILTILNTQPFKQLTET